MKRPRAPWLGFTLVEVLVAVTILSLALLAFLSAIVASGRSAAKGDYYILAARAAGDRLAAVRAGGYAALSDGATEYTVSGLPGGRMRVTVGPLDGSAAYTDIRQVDVRVTWDSPTPGEPALAGEVRASTLAARPR